jgi:hypothetical protein
LVSDAEPREALTPWGKMTSSFDVARSADPSPERASWHGLAAVAFGVARLVITETR